MIAVAFRPRADHVRHEIDYLGAALLAGGLSGVALFTSLTATTSPWAPVPIVGLMVLGAALLTGVVLVELRAAEPILPPERSGTARSRGPRSTTR